MYSTQTHIQTHDQTYNQTQTSFPMFRIKLTFCIKNTKLIFDASESVCASACASASSTQSLVSRRFNNQKITKCLVRKQCHSVSSKVAGNFCMAFSRHMNQAGEFARRHDISTQCCFNAGPASSTLVQH